MASRYRQATFVIDANRAKSFKHRITGINRRLFHRTGTANYAIRAHRKITRLIHYSPHFPTSELYVRFGKSVKESELNLKGILAY